MRFMMCTMGRVRERERAEAGAGGDAGTGRRLRGNERGGVGSIHIQMYINKSICVHAINAI